ncbi:HesB/IscA family protein [Nitrosovibrio tenuis]|uniref:Iron-sulfur cluster assembly protein n=1 Tax=Nitrosovibrio tenuis TaxID=1233 RepID=A0A1H7GZ00_9PROT|nr:iron-sulfur cluster assembly accessory protein [Nitrosovibrio tenuis]SEK43268.1 iron-sulfur cluster assembly protein [Nitrosovibrio tenuis]
MAVTLTENAAKQIRKQVAKRGKGLGLRIGIKKEGCSGFAYTFDYADELRAGDQMFESCNANVVIDAGSLPYIDGSQVDFVKEGLNDSFRVGNPNVDNTCGCGESFSVKEPARISLL